MYHVSTGCILTRYQAAAIVTGDMESRHWDYFLTSLCNQEGHHLTTSHMLQEPSSSHINANRKLGHWRDLQIYQACAVAYFNRKLPRYIVLAEVPAQCRGQILSVARTSSLKICARVPGKAIPSRHVLGTKAYSHKKVLPLKKILMPLTSKLGPR